MLRVLNRCRLDPLPSSWLDLLRQAIEQEDPALKREAVAVVKVRNLDRFDAQLATLSRNEAMPAELRIAALECLAPRRKETEETSFALLKRNVSEQTDPLLRIAAARTLGASTLDGPQLTQLAKHLISSGTLTMRLLLPAFAKSKDGEIGKQLAEALARSPAAEALSLSELDQTFRGYPGAVRTGIQSLREKLIDRRKQQAAYITDLSAQLSKTKGNAPAGREVFFSRKVGCYACHRAAGTGGQVGPDLSQIGRFRSRAELLESIVFPSLVIAPEFRSFRIGTKSGRFVTGLIVRESTDAIELRTPDLAEVRVARKDIEVMEPSDVSLMPDGMDKVMTRQEFADLLEFLLAQR